MPRAKLKAKLKIEPGLAKFDKKHSEIGAYLEPLLSFAKKELGDSVNLAQVSLNLEATGGVRALNRKSQKRLMGATQRVLKSSGFKNPKAEVISGVKEGIYQWISINYLRGAFENPEKQSTGFIEMGGASVQVTFLRQEPLTSPLIDSQLYSRTYDGLGETNAWNQFGAKSCQLIPLDYETCRKSLDKHLKVLHRPKLPGPIGPKAEQAYFV